MSRELDLTVDSGGGSQIPGRPHAILKTAANDLAAGFHRVDAFAVSALHSCRNPRLVFTSLAKFLSIYWLLIGGWV